MSEERKNAVTFKGNAITLVGAEIKVGDKAPDFKILGNDLSEATLATFAGKTKVISVVPSLDTPICDLQTKRFNEEAAKFPASFVTLTISVDLPFAQRRWCGASSASNVKTFSDHRDTSFGKAFGVLIKELRLLTRAVFVIGADDKVQYAEYVKEVTEHPNYDKVLNFLKTSVQA